MQFHAIKYNRDFALKIVRIVFVFLSCSIFNFQFSVTYAQKFPERRATRQGTRLYGQGDFAGAETRYREALEINPELREAAFNLGNVLWRGEKVQEAADAWTAIVNDSLAPPPMVSAASYNLGNAALAGRQIDAAIEAYKAALRIAPDDAQAKYNLAYAQKLKQQQQQQDQNQDQNQDDQGGGQNDQDQNQDQDQDQDKDQDGDGKNDPQDGQGDPPPPTQGNGEPGIDPRTAGQMLDAMQAAEDDTREKVNAREVQAGARSGKNW
jgi:tetratricopeptide (TPR) repeat protein